MMKAETTRRHILERGLELVSLKGLKGVTLGDLAERAQLSKSGLYAHFGSVQTLQLALLEAAGERARSTVVEPALEAPDGLPRLRSFFEHFLGWAPKSGLPGGCPFLGAAAEFDDEPGAVHDFLAATVERMVGDLAELVARAATLRHIREDTDAKQVAWQLFGIYTMHHTLQRLVQDPRADQRAHDAFETLLTQVGATPAAGN